MGRPKHSGEKGEWKFSHSPFSPLCFGLPILPFPPITWSPHAINRITSFSYSWYLLCFPGFFPAFPGFPMPCRDFPCFPRISHAFPGFPMLSRDFSGFWWHLLFGAVLFLLLYCARKAAGERKTSCIALALCLNFSKSFWQQLFRQPLALEL